MKLGYLLLFLSIICLPELAAMVTEEKVGEYDRVCVVDSEVEPEQQRDLAVENWIRLVAAAQETLAVFSGHIADSMVSTGRSRDPFLSHFCEQNEQLVNNMNDVAKDIEPWIEFPIDSMAIMQKPLESVSDLRDRLYLKLQKAYCALTRDIVMYKRHSGEIPDLSSGQIIECVVRHAAKKQGLIF